MKLLLLPSLCAALAAGCNPVDPVVQADPGGPAASTQQANPGSTNPTAAVTAGIGVPSSASSVSTTSTTLSNVPSPAAPAPTAPATAPATNTPVAAAVPAVPLPKPPPELPGTAQEVIRLSQTSVDSTVIISYIDSLREPFTLNADQIIYLSDLGLGNEVINALLKKANSSAVPTSPAVVSNPPLHAEATPAPVTPPNAAATAAVGSPIIYPGGSTPASPPVYGQPQVGTAPAPAPAPVQVQAPAQTQVVVNQPVSTTVFYESLSPYGNWVQVEPYGWCWQPTIVSVTPTWRPYCDGGQWLWTDHGWYWQSTYSWGWAPFHYGRWHRSASIGWVWCPGTDWGPAWVSWRYNDAHCGWAPLPPECSWSVGVGFTWSSRGTRVSVGFGIFDDCWYATSWNRFCDPGLPRWCLDRRDVPRFVHNSRQAIGGDNSVNIVGNNNTVIINNGIAADEVQRRGRQEVRKYAVADAASPEQAARRVGNAGSGNRTEVAAFRPRVNAEAGRNTAPPPSVIARQEARKAGNTPGTASGIVPARSGSGPDSIGNRPPARPGAPSVGNSLPTTSGSKLSETPQRPVAGNGNQTGPSRNTHPALTPGRPVAEAGSPSPAGPAPTRPQAISRPEPSVGNARPSGTTAPARSVPYPGSGVPSTGSPGNATPARPSPVTAPQTQFRPAPAAQAPTVAQDSRALQQVPSGRTELRKPETAFRSTAPQAEAAPSFSTRGPAPSAQGVGGGFQGRNSSMSASPAPSAAARPSAPAPVVRSVPAPSAPQPSAPVRSAGPQPSYSAPARSMPAAPQQGGGARPSPSRGQNPAE